MVTLPGGDPTSVWNAMKQHLIAGDIAGAVLYFSSATASKYRGVFLSIGTTDLAPIISGIPNITPVFIGPDAAEYRFDQIIQGYTITFPVEFKKENNTWKIVDY
jgi:hypothetical protein